MNYKTLQDSIIREYRMTIETNSKCYGRTHVHVKKRTICKWKQASSLCSTFTLLHEIGHCENNNSSMRRCEQEFYATQWALDKCKEIGLNVTDDIIKKYQRYINDERQRGINRHCYDLPSIEELTLVW